MILIIGGAFQGKKDYASKQFPDRPVIADVHKKIWNWMKEGADPVSQMEQLILQAKKENMVVLTDEIGYGIVPEDAFFRAYREEVGRLCCMLAAEAETVIRVVAGVGMIIKDEDEKEKNAGLVT